MTNVEMTVPSSRNYFSWQNIDTLSSIFFLFCFSLVKEVLTSFNLIQLHFGGALHIHSKYFNRERACDVKTSRIGSYETQFLTTSSEII